MAHSNGGRRQESLTVTSGRVLLIDQFMLGNEQFIEASDLESGSCERLQAGAQRYGGGVIELPVGRYLLYRDPRQQLMAVYPESLDTPVEEGTGDDVFDAMPAVVEELFTSAEEVTPEFHAYIDTRCLAFVDPAFLQDDASMEKYKEYRKTENDKSARDLIRRNGGAVRYGFSKRGDELAVVFMRKEHTIFLWPDVAEE